MLTSIRKGWLFALVGDVYCIFVTFPCGILGQVWYLIVSFPDFVIFLWVETVETRVGPRVGYPIH